MSFLTVKRGRAFRWRWPLVMFIGLSILWAGWYLVTGNTPTVRVIPFDKNTTTLLPFSIGAWWTAILIPLWIFIMVRIATQPSRPSEDKFSIGLVAIVILMSLLISLIVIFIMMIDSDNYFFIGLFTSLIIGLLFMFTSVRCVRIGFFFAYPLLFSWLHWGYGLLILGVMILVYFLFESMVAFVRSHFERTCLNWILARDVVNNSTSAQ